MVQPNLTSRFWSVVEDCLVDFHHLERKLAAEKVTTLWTKLPGGPEPNGQQPSLDDIIYHAEPWYIACNLAGHELRISDNESGYREILRKNQLA